jgi:hypothetical protein
MDFYVKLEVYTGLTACSSLLHGALAKVSIVLVEIEYILSFPHVRVDCSD